MMHLCGRPGTAGHHPRVVRILIAAVAITILGLSAAPASVPQVSAPRATATHAHSCRFWGLIGGGYPDSLIADHLSTGAIASLRELGATNPEGWGFTCFPADQAEVALARPLARRGGPAANNPYDPDYDLAVAEIDLLRPAAALGHVRGGISGHLGIPDPHPFLLRFLTHNVAFAHNGALSVEGLKALLGSFIDNDAHPPDYQRGDIGETGPLDSELYFLFLKKFVEEHQELDLTAALVQAVGELSADETVVGDSAQLNFVLTDGDTLYALHYYGEGSENPVRYYPALARPGEGESPYWVVASEVLGSNEEEWGTIPARTLAVLIPGRVPQFHAVQFTSQNSATPEPAATPSLHPIPEVPQPAGLAESPHNCRFWGLIGAGYPVSLMTDHLWDGEYRNLRELSGWPQYNDDGWGLAYFVPDAFGLPLNSPVIRRGGPAAQHDDDYQITVYEMRAIAPPVAIGHVRNGTSGHTGIPNPHPFQHRGMLFAHNGGLEKIPLEERLGDDLTTHPADYTPGSEGTRYIDSELCFLYLLKLVDERPGVPFPEALLEALRELVEDSDIVGSRPKLNFVLTDGDTLYALHCYGYGTSNSVRYYPAGSGDGHEASPAGSGDGHEASPYWVVASEPLGLTSDGWGTIPARTLVVFVPGEAPRFMPLDGPQYSFGSVEIAERIDQDEDEWISRFALRCDPDMIVDSAEVFVRISAAPAGEDWLELAGSDPAWIYGSDPDTFSIPCSVDTVDPDLPPTSWDLKVELYAAGVDTLLVAVTHATHPEWELGDVQVEGSARDTVPDLPREFAFAWVGRSGEVDEDGDGYLSAFHLQWDGNLSPEWDSVLVRVEALGFDGSSLIPLGATEDYWLRGLAPDTVSLVVEVTPEDRLPGIWDLALQMRDVEAQTVVANAWTHDFAALSGVWVEGSDEDAPAPDSLEAWVGAIRPNPGPGNAEGRFEIPLNVPAGGAEVILEIWDATGRLVWQDGPRGLDAGRQELLWYGRSLEGVAVPSGSYFGKIRIGEKISRRCFVLVR